MAKKTRTELSTLAVNTNLPDNTSEQITPTTERAQLTEERASVLNYKDDLGGTSNAGKFLTVGSDGESLTMVDEPSGVPDWVTFATASGNLMMLKSGSNTVQIRFYDSDGTTLGAQMTWDQVSSSLNITNSQSSETIQLVGGEIYLQTGGTTRLKVSSGGSLLVKTTTTSGIGVGDIGLDNGALRGGIIRARNAADNAYKALIYLDGNDAVQVGTAATGLTISSGGNATLNGYLKLGTSASQTILGDFGETNTYLINYNSGGTLKFLVGGGASSNERLTISSGGDLTASNKKNSSTFTDKTTTSYAEEKIYEIFTTGSSSFDISTVTSGYVSGSLIIECSVNGQFGAFAGIAGSYRKAVVTFGGSAITVTDINSYNGQIGNIDYTFVSHGSMKITLSSINTAWGGLNGIGYLRVIGGNNSSNSNVTPLSFTLS